MFGKLDSIKTSGGVKNKTLNGKKGRWSYKNPQDPGCSKKVWINDKYQ